MSQITNDIEFKQALQELDHAQHRIIAAMFVEHLLPLTTDKRIKSIVKTALDPNASEDELASAYKSARAATFDSHTRCGSEGHWTDQAAYFVARAAVAALATDLQSKSGGPAWQAALSLRMAQTCLLIDSDENAPTETTNNEWQYKILSNYLNS